MTKGTLLLETGDMFQGNIMGNQEEATGEVVFNTSMTGYQEMMTDPSYAGQILIFCYPLIGNYGWNLLDDESDQCHLSGMVVDELCAFPHHHRSESDLEQQLQKAGVTCLSGVDTRALVKKIRQYGSVKGIIIQQDQAPQPQELTSPTFWEKRHIPQPDSLHWVEQVSTKQSKTFAPLSEGQKQIDLNPAQGTVHSVANTSGQRDESLFHVVLMNYGYKKSIVDHLRALGCRVTVVPYATSFEKIEELSPDGVVFSNGPGDPMALQPYFAQIKAISEAYPSLGICLGHQLLALAHGARTKKLKYGHRGANHPVKHIQSGKVMLTPQNHGYVVLEESLASTSLQVTYTQVNDGSVEGLQHAHLPLQTVQFHPESNAGPTDTDYVFQQFIDMVVRHQQTGDMHYAIT